MGAVSCRWGACPAVQSQAVLGLPSALSGAGTAEWGSVGLELQVTAGTTRWEHLGGGRLAQTLGVREGFLQEVTWEPSPEA